MDYTSALLEFDQLWASKPTPQSQERIDQLAAIILALETQAQQVEGQPLARLQFA
jgi:hypothetical protein